MAKKVLKNLKKYWLIGIFLIVILLRLPSFFEPFTYGDEGIYLTLGQAARHGLVWYRDIHDNKPPMLYLVAAIAGNFSTYRMIYFLWTLVTIAAFYRLSQTLFKKNLLAVIFSTTLFAILTNIHSFEGNVANAENFMLLPTITGVFFILKGLDSRGLRRTRPSEKIDRLLVRRADLRGYLSFFSAGILLSIATLFKIPTAFDFAALCVFLLLIFFEKTKKNYSLFIIHYSLFISGFTSPILLTIIYYFFQNALPQYLTAAFFQNLPYLSSWGGTSQAQAGGLPLALFIRASALVLIPLLLLLFRKKISLATKLILLWFTFSWFAALLSSRPYPHYLIQIFPSLSLSAGLLFLPQKQLLKEKIVPFFLALAFIATSSFFQFWHYPDLPYYQNFYQYFLGRKTKEEYFTDFDARASAFYQVAYHLQNQDYAGKTLFVWGTAPHLYPLSRRIPAGRYAATYHIVDFDGYQETMKALETQKPPDIVVDLEEKHPFPEFFFWLEENYLLEKQIDDFLIYHRLL